VRCNACLGTTAIRVGVNCRLKLKKFPSKNLLTFLDPKWGKGSKLRCGQRRIDRRLKRKESKGRCRESKGTVELARLWVIGGIVSGHLDGGRGGAMQERHAQKKVKGGFPGCLKNAQGFSNQRPKKGVKNGNHGLPKKRQEKKIALMGKFSSVINWRRRGCL